MLIVAQLVETFPDYRPHVSLLCSQDPATRTYPELQSISLTSILTSRIYALVSQVITSFQIFGQIFCIVIFAACYMFRPSYLVFIRAVMLGEQYKL
jgi:hypothetical protein